MPPRAIVIGGGHNGLVCAAYLARAGLEVTVLERRERVGGACVTEEMGGCRVSRAAYLLSLFRPQIARELELERHGLSLIPRRPSSLTPLPDGRSLVLGRGLRADCEEIARFSKRDAASFPRYQAWLGRVAAAAEPLLDVTPPALPPRSRDDLRALGALARAAFRLRGELGESARLLLGSASELLYSWFDSEPLRGTLATDAVIGAFAPPSSPGTGYVLFHHCMGELGGARGVWAYVRGGMGRLAEALAESARAAGAHIKSGAPVERILTRAGRAVGVTLADGEQLDAELCVSSVDPRRTFELLDDATQLPDSLRRGLAALDFRSPVVKLNLVLDREPRFHVRDREREEVPLTGTIHVGAVELPALERAFADAAGGEVSRRPLVELTLPSVLDDSLAPMGGHVASVFAQYAPVLPPEDPRWSALRAEMQARVLAELDAVAPGFSDSIRALEVLAAPELEREFGLTGGNIFHGAMSPDRLFFLRPLPELARYRTPVRGLWMCGAGTHPGGGVLGAPGRNAAREILRSERTARKTR
jgi:phytoene dehydrogenase-like protein